jgi:hypothetical protein
MSNTIQVFPTRVHQPSGLLVGREWTSEQIIEKERAQGFERRLGQRR